MSKEWDWIIAEASNSFLRAIWRDLGADRRNRKSLLDNYNITQQFYSSSAGQLSYLSSDNFDNSKDIIVLIHGTPGSALSWSPYLKDPDHKNYISIDRPGYGPIKETPNLKRDVNTLTNFINDISNNRNIYLVGHSMGGGIASRLAVENSKCVKGLILIGSSLDPDLEKIFTIQKLAEKAPLKWLLSRSVYNSNHELLQYKNFLNELKADLHKVNCPVTIIHTKDDGLVPYKNVEYIKSHFSKAQTLNIIDFDHGGHFINRTKPEILKKAINEL
jgi:pimeloyl-ACP methyl ester carboxylesterase